MHEYIFLLCMATIKQLKIKWIRSPPLSPDSNPIELVWADMKRFIRKRFCASVAELRKAVQDFRNTVMTPEYCGRYVSRLKKVIKIVIKKTENGQTANFFLSFFFFFLPNFIRNNPKLLPNFLNFYLK